MSNFRILDEGYKPIVITFIIALVIKIFISDFLGNIGIFLSLFMVFVYRDITRDIFISEDAILSPVDGTITAIDYINAKQIIYCDVNLCDTHILRAPVAGKIKIKTFFNGLNLSASSYKAKQLNQRAVIKFNNLKVRLLGGVCNNKILIDDKNELNQGERFGLFFNGLVAMEIKNDLKLSVKIGDNIKAGQTIIGKYK